MKTRYKVLIGAVLLTITFGVLSYFGYLPEAIVPEILNGPTN